MTKLITFDLWGTLIKSNPVYINERNKLYEDYNIDPELRKRLKVALDETMSLTGTSFSTFTMYSLLLKMNGDKNNKNWSRLYEQSKLLVECFPPLLVFPDTIEALELIKSKGIYMGVISNTTFISGESLIEVLKHYSILQYFSYCYFSDQHRYCKPDANAFSVARLNILYKEPLLLEGNYLHIGNDPVTDNTSEAGKRWNHLLINEDSSNSLVELIKDIT